MEAYSDVDTVGSEADTTEEIERAAVGLVEVEERIEVRDGGVIVVE